MLVSVFKANGYSRRKSSTRDRDQLNCGDITMIMLIDNPSEEVGRWVKKSRYF